MADHVSVIDDLAAFAQADMPRYITGVRRMWCPQLAPAGALRDFFEHGPGLLVEVYYDVTGRELWIDTRDLLEAYFAGVRRDPTRQMMYLSPGPEGDWRPIGDAPLEQIMPATPPGPYGIAGRLRPLLHDLSRDSLDLGGEKSNLTLGAGV
jgi:hypothetical protein